MIRGFGGVFSQMNRFALSFFAVAFSAHAVAQEKSVPLFDGKTMTGWYVYLKEGGKNPAEQNEITVADGCFHIKGEKLGYLSTEKEYSRYKLTMSYRWSAPVASKEVKRNSGLIYHAVGEDRMWCNGMEFQMQQDDAGDLWLIPGKEANARVMVDGKEIGGSQKGERILKTAAAEKPVFEWNTFELVCRGKEFEHWVNGKKVLSGACVDRDKGKIQFQAEGHEVWIKDIMIESLAKP